MQPFDLHTHSVYSDGTERPADIVRAAKAAGLAFVALTDHDTICGVPEAVQEGTRIGMRVIPGVEFDIDYHVTMHILGLGINPEAEELKATLAESAQKRARRNAAMLARLREIGCPIEDAIEGEGLITRLHMANALVKKGYALSRADAFDKFLLKGRPAFVRSENISIARAVAVAHAAGGIAVLAHPCQIRADKHAAVLDAVRGGVDGIEVFYPGTTEGERTLFLSLARQHGLLITSGSDFHGANRPAATLGCAWEDTPLLEPVFERFMT